ncbi:Acyltransferase [Lentilactobacillus rapi DSM 19907 = JCM 15042]|uniref:1-acyl-sn-glycerol-3-phosphate acyltransferase n=3 Tax=Lentilactobacillus rapi TaxID=481723 RepID=A0A512PJQ0_9LACO|nr:lysophospholipid acyltransferase family protein [Lentilactobacillus rapi]KRL16028.1 Acyltransferase [Lentilactobacillus rapi DSM 19907 = JCM 15042]GEP71430.1 1-acyl-sn-glycerol-3-phosphate acyltransferase [Lentilactobacillus rapi]
MTFTPVKLGDRDKVIANIEANANRGHFNDKVEIHDPVLNLDQQHEVLKTYLALRQTHRYQWRGAEARSMMNVAANMAAADMKVRGAENLTNISWPAIITCNHFSPIDSLLVRSALKQPDLAIVVELTNLKMSGMLGFLMTYADTIPISDSIEYMGHEFISLLKQALSHQQSILIYPEREMWFNYRKPRPAERGAYYYAVKLNVPIVSCFVSMVDAPTKNDPHGIDFTFHILPPIFPDQQSGTPREVADKMRRIDEQQKMTAYEAAYKRPFRPAFENQDIAGHYG